MRTKATWADAAVAVLCLVCAAALFCAGFIGRRAGDVLVVTDLSTGERTEYRLDEDRELTFTGGGVTLTVEIRDGGVRVRESDCPDQVCVHGGEIRRAGQTLVCAPAGFSFTVRSAAPGGGEPDAVLG